MSWRKFNVGDKIRIVSDKCKDYGRFLYAVGKVSFVGARYKGHNSYLVRFSHDNELAIEIRVFEEDMDFIH